MRASALLQPAVYERGARLARRAAPGDRVRVLNEELFRTAFNRERKRADRFNQKVVLLTVSIDAVRDAGVPIAWTRVINALAAVKRPFDLVGWVVRDTTLGFIVPEIRESDVRVPEELSRRVRRHLETHLGPDQGARVSIRMRVHPNPRPAVDEVPDIDAHHDQAQTLARAAYPVLKRGCDIAGSVMGLLALSPVLVIVAALVKLTSRGPVLFRQPRVGHKERTFTMLKFRTMRADADHTLHQQYVSWFITASDRAPTTGTDASFKLAGDPRVTRVGAILRKTSLDELPQLWNVLCGEMSLVGPRPPLDYEVRQYAPWHRRRVMDVKPGMTGLWQVTGRSCTTFDQMVRLDLRYAKTCSLWSDLKILLATPAAVLSGKGAR